MRRRRLVPQNNAMQLTRGGWSRMGASWSGTVIVNEGKVVRPSQLIASVGRTTGEGRMKHSMVSALLVSSASVLAAAPVEQPISFRGVTPVSLKVEMLPAPDPTVAADIEALLRRFLSQLRIPVAEDHAAASLVMSITPQCSESLPFCAWHLQLALRETVVVTRTQETRVATTWSAVRSGFYRGFSNDEPAAPGHLQYIRNDALSLIHDFAAALEKGKGR